jgi:hypothetical protein
VASQSSSRRVIVTRMNGFASRVAARQWRMASQPSSRPRGSRESSASPCASPHRMRSPAQTAVVSPASRVERARSGP